MSDAGLAVLTVLLALDTIVVAVVALRSVSVLRRYAERIPLVQPKGRPFRVSAILAGDSDSSPMTTIGDLNAQNYPDLDVIAAMPNPPIVETANLTLLRTADGLPDASVVDAGVAQAAAASSAEWLLITEAGARLDRLATASILAAARSRSADVLTAFGKQTAAGWMRTALPVLAQLFSLGSPVESVNDPARPRVAIGRREALLIRRSTYQAAGGWLPAADPANDLVRRAKGQGARVVLADGRSIVTAPPLRDWAAGIRRAAPAALIAGGLAIVALTAVLPFVLMIVGLVGGLLDSASRVWTLLGLFGVAQSLLVLGARRVVDGFTTVPVWFGPTHPVGGCIVLGILMAALLGRSDR